VTQPSQIQALVDTAEARFGPIDLFCSNAGVISLGGADASDADWKLSLEVNVMAHVYAARILVPMMLERGGGYLLQTASAAGLLTQLGSAPYSVTKHAALALAEWLAITYGDRGLKVSVLAPQAVRTAMTGRGRRRRRRRCRRNARTRRRGRGGGCGDRRGVVLDPPHPQVLEYFQRKASDYERWLRGMRRLQAEFGGAGIASGT